MGFADNVTAYDSPEQSEKWSFEEGNGMVLDEDVISVALTHELRKLCSMNSAVGLREILPHEGIRRFYSKKVQSIPLERYVTRLVRYMSCSRATFIVAYCYLHRIRKYEPRLVVSHLNVNRLLITAMVLAAKYMEDRVYTNSYYARVGGIPTLEEMNHLEAEFLHVLHFDLSLDPREYRSMEAYLTGVAAGL